YRTLRQAGLVERVPGPDGTSTVRLVGEVPDEFALNTPLSPFALAALELLDPEDADFALDVVSVIEATLEDPRPLVFAQQRAARDEAMAAMKAEGWEYTDRMNALEEVTYPQPLAELLSAALAEYAATNPWVDEYELRPKSVVREMAENAMTFSELISKYQIARSEGVVLRYLSDAYKALRQVVPTAMRTEELEALIEWLGTLVHQIDSSLLAEWEALQSGDGEASVDALRSASAGLPEAAGAEEPEARFGHGRDATLRAASRNALFQRVELAARENYERRGRLDQAIGWDETRWAEAMADYFAEYEDIGIGAEARSAGMVRIDKDPETGTWHATQILDD